MVIPHHHQYYTTAVTVDDDGDEDEVTFRGALKLLTRVKIDDAPESVLPPDF